MSFILSVISMIAAGLFLSLLVINRRSRSYTFREISALSYFLGAGFVSYQCLVFYLVGVEFSLMNLVMLPVALFVLAFSLYASRAGGSGSPGSENALSEGWNAASKLLLLGIIVQVAWTVLLVLPVPVHSHDAVANYALKAKIFHLAGGVPRGFFGWGETTVAHPDYPPLLPFVMTWTYAFTGFNDLLVNMIMPVSFAAYLLLFYSLMSRSFSRSYSLLIVFLLATIPQLADYATVIHADLFLAAYVSLALGYFIIYVRERDRSLLAFSSVLMGFSLWVKNEAIVFTAAYAVIVIIYLVKERRVRGRRALADALMALFIIVAVAAPWIAVKLTQCAGNSDIDLSKLTFERLMRNFRGIPVIFNLFQQEVFGPKKWNIFWMVFFAALIWKRRSLPRGQNLYICVFLGLSSLGYFAGYMMTTGEDLYFYVNTTISRFMLHFTGLSILLVSFLLREEVGRFESFLPGGDVIDGPGR